MWVSPRLKTLAHSAGGFTQSHSRGRSPRQAWLPSFVSVVGSSDLRPLSEARKAGSWVACGVGKQHSQARWAVCPGPYQLCHLSFSCPLLFRTGQMVSVWHTEPGTTGPWGLPSDASQGLMVRRVPLGWVGAWAAPWTAVLCLTRPRRAAPACGWGPAWGCVHAMPFPQDPRGLPQAHQPPRLHQPHPRLHHAEQCRPRRRGPHPQPLLQEHRKLPASWVGGAGPTEARAEARASLHQHCLVAGFVSPERFVVEDKPLLNRVS